MLVGCQSAEEEAQDHLEKGKALLEKGDLAAAQLEFKNAGKATDSISDTYYYMALLDEKNQNFISMRKNLEKTIKLDPDNIVARIKLGKLLLLFNKVDEALIHADKALELQADEPSQEALLLKASAKIRQNDKEEATKIIENVLTENPENVDAISLQVAMLMMDQKFDESLLRINEAITIEPENISLLGQRIRINLKKKDWQAVIEDYENLVRVFPENLDYAYRLAGLYRREKRIDEAEQILLKVIRDNPKEQKAKFVYLTFLGEEDKAKAESQLQDYLKQYQENAQVSYEFANWMMANNYAQNAEKTLQQIVEQGPDSDLGLSARIMLSRLALQQNNLIESKKIVDNILEQRPDYVDAKLLKARILLLRRELDDSIKSSKSVLLVNPNSDEAMVLLAQAYEQKGERKSARKNFRRAFEINPRNIQAVMAEYDRAMKKKNLKMRKAFWKSR